MNNETKIPWLKIIGWAMLIHVILIVISITEVFIYSLIRPGEENSFYEDHATLTAPYISIFFGFFAFFLVTRLLVKNRIEKRISIVLSLAVFYTVSDFIIVHWSGVDWAEHILVFIISALVKTAGGFAGAFSLKKA